jgi:hypothetical protein
VNAPVDFDGGARLDPDYPPPRRPVFYETRDGWHEVEIEDGVELLYPWLRK